MKSETTGSFQTCESDYQKGHYHISYDHSLRWMIMEQLQRAENSSIEGKLSGNAVVCVAEPKQPYFSLLFSDIMCW
jgi:hypothetical protein